MEIGIDYETYLISNDFPIPKPVCLSYYTEKGEQGLLVGKKEIEEKLKEWLENNDKLIAHNATFEFLVTYEHFPALRCLLWKQLDAGKIFCTQLYQQLINNISKGGMDINLSLADLVKRYFRIDISESKTDPNAWRLRYSELDGLPLDKWPQAAIDYAISDSIYAFRIYKEQLKLNKVLVYKEHVQASSALNLMAAPGILIEKERVLQLEQEVNDKINPIYTKLESEGFMNRSKKGLLSKNIKGLQEYVKSNFIGIKYAPKGGIKVNREAMESYVLEKEDEVLSSFLVLSGYEKAKSAYISHLKEANPVIRTSYDAIKRSGRSSSRVSKAYPSVNIQNQPRQLKGVTWDIRNCYIPRPGYKLVTIDYQNLELLSCANELYRHYNKSKMRDLINSGEFPTDLHSIFACELMSSDLQKQVSYEEFMLHKKEKEYSQYRDKGKPVTLGLPGGIGADKIRGQYAAAGIQLFIRKIKSFNNEYKAYSVIRRFNSEYPNLRVQRTGVREWTVVDDEIVRLKKLLFRLYPELEQFLREGHKKFLNGETGWKKGDWGDWEEEPYYRYNSHGVRRDYCSYTAFCNGYLMQGPSAVGAKKAVYDIVRFCEGNDSIRPLAFIHDEIVFEIKDDSRLTDNIDSCANIMIDSMKAVLKNVRITCEAELKDYWAKGVNTWARLYWKDQDTLQLKWK